MSSFADYDNIVVSPNATVFEHGWQSWSPTTTYPATATSWRPVRLPTQVMAYRPGLPGPEVGFQGEGLLGVDPGDGGPVRLYAAMDGVDEVPSIRAELSDGRVLVRANGAVETWSGDSFATVLAAWAAEFARRAGVGAIPPAPTVWCSWYHYFTAVTEAHIVENIDAIDAQDLPVDVVQIDDGWQTDIGDWLTYSDKFPSFPELIRRIRDAGRRAGIWVAPFLVAARSETATKHPDWLIQDTAGQPVDAGYNWDTPLYGLDATHPGVRSYLTEVFRRLHALDIDYFKIDFIYSGALDGVRHDGSSPLSAYRSGVSLIRDAIGSSYLLGCGAPILPTVGLVDAMRVSGDVAPTYEAANGDDPSQPSQLGATLSTVGRAFQHGRFWVNDPDCLIARPEVERREDWAQVVERYGGLRASSDRVASLDRWGLETTRRVLSEVPPPTPFS